MRKLFFGIMSLLLFSGAIFLPIVAQAKPCILSVSVSKTLELPAAIVSVIPKLAIGNIGDNITIAITVTNVADLFAWQIGLKFNGTVLNCTGVWVPEDNIFAGHLGNYGGPIFGVDINDGSNWVLFGYTLLDNDHIDLSEGTLFRANFTIEADGMSPILIATEEKPIRVGEQEWETWNSYVLDHTIQGMPFNEVNGKIASGSLFVLTITTTEGGTTDPAPDFYGYPPGTNISITALPEVRNDFYYWELNDLNVGQQNPYNLTMDANHTLYAIFGPHQSITWTVGKNDPADFHTMQEALDSPIVAFDDVVFVKSGIYYEHVSTSKQLTLLGENRDTTIIDGNGTGTVVLPNGNLSGFTIRNGQYGVQIRTLNVTPSFTGCRIEGNRIINNAIGAILLAQCANNTISSNIIGNNTLFGIHLKNADNNTLTSNTIANNQHGIDLYGNPKGNIFRKNIIKDNKYNFGVILRGETWQYISTTPQPLVNDLDTSNTINGKPIYYWINQSNTQVPSDAGYVLLDGCQNITIDGCSLSNNLQGIFLLNTNNTWISNSNLTDNAHGIYLFRSSNTTMTDNALRDNQIGIYLGDFSKFTTMRNNAISGGQMNFGITPFVNMYARDGSDMINDIDTSNTLEGKPIVYWANEHDKQVPPNAGYVMLISSTNILVRDLNLTNNAQNLFIIASNNTIIENNSISNSLYGIDVRSFYYFNDVYGPPIVNRSFNTTINGNDLINNGVGIRIASDNSIVTDNTLKRNPLGICLADTSNSIILRNMIVESDLNQSHPDIELYIFYYPEWPWEYSLELKQMEIGGIFVGGENNKIYGNTVTNSFMSISMIDFIRSYYGQDNSIFHNNFINSTSQYPAIEGITSNYWDNDYPSGGNYWGGLNYTDFYSGQYQNETGGDGISDNPSPIIGSRSSSRSFDNYPLTAPISSFDIVILTGVTSLDVAANSTISNFQLREAEKAIIINLTGADGTTGFCRITIPNDMIQNYWHGDFTVMISGHQIAFRNWTGSTDTIIYFTYQHSERQVTIVPEFHPMAILLSTVLVTTVAVITKKRRRGRITQLPQRALARVKCSHENSRSLAVTCAVLHRNL